jgi:hypothetical protein
MVEFKVDIYDYGRHGVTVKEPRTRAVGYGATKDEALDDLKVQLAHRIECEDVPPPEGPVHSIEIITV